MKEYLEKLIVSIICSILAITIIAVSLYYRSIMIMLFAIIGMVVAIIVMMVSMIVSILKNDIEEI